MSRFKVGDRIKILSVMNSPFVGLEGEIVEVRIHEQSINTLDRYLVMFAWGEKEIFYEVQLVHAAATSRPDGKTIADSAA